MKSAALTALALCALAACAGNPYSALDDPRPEGRLSLRERSLCEMPDQADSRWCELPHEVRVFTERREACDHFRGEPWPEGGHDDDRARRKELTAKMRDAPMARQAWRMFLAWRMNRSSSLHANICAQPGSLSRDPPYVHGDSPPVALAHAMPPEAPAGRWLMSPSTTIHGLASCRSLRMNRRPRPSTF